jgi:hypothetical protein
MVEFFIQPFDPENTTLKSMSNKNVNDSFKKFSAFLAFIIWGSWAYFVNHDVISAFSQGTASFIITLILIYIVTFIFNLLPENKLIKIIFPAIIAVSITGTFLVIVHLVVDTKEIFYTIFPPISVAFIFCIITALKLSKIHNV